MTESSREAGIAKMKAFCAKQSTATLCEAIVGLTKMPRTQETALSRAVMFDVLCARHPEAEAAAEAWAESDDASIADHDAAVIGAALKALGV